MSQNNIQQIYNSTSQFNNEMFERMSKKMTL